MRCAMVFLGVCLLFGILPAGALAGGPLWTHSVPSEITGLSLTPDGSYVLTGGDRLCFLAGNGTPLWQEGTADLTACSADGRLIAGATGTSLTLFGRDAARVRSWDLPSVAVALVLFPDGKRVVAADRFGKVYFYDADGTLRATADTRGDPEDGIEAFSGIRDVALSGKGEYVAVISSRGLFYYTGAGRSLWALEGSLAGATAVAVSGTGNEIAAGSDANVRLLDRTGKVLWTHRCPRPVTALAIAQDGSRVVFGMQDNSLTCFDREGGEVWTFAAGGWVRDVAVSQDGSRVLAGSMDGRAYLLDGTGRLLDTYTLDGWVNHVALTPDGTMGAAASLHEVVGVSAAAVAPSPTVTTSSPTTATPSPTVTGPSPTTATPSPATTPGNATPLPPEGDGNPLLLVLGLLACGVTVGAGYLYRERRQAGPAIEVRDLPAGAEKIPPAVEEEVPPVVEGGMPADPVPVGAPSVPWRVSLDGGRTREAARLLSREMTGLLRNRTGSRIVTTADALDALPGEREGLARFFADADRLAYGHDNPTRADIEALEAAYLRLAGEIG